jgi:hypothetical protein
VSKNLKFLCLAALVFASGIKLGQDVGGQVAFANGVVRQVRVMTR